MSFGGKGERGTAEGRDSSRAEQKLTLFVPFRRSFVPIFCYLLLLRRNKVSARAFRARRKDYIDTLEGQLAEKDGESGRSFVQLVSSSRLNRIDSIRA